MTLPDPTSSAEEVLDVFRDECRSMVEGRADLLDGILDDSFTAQHITGYVSSKAEWLHQIRSGDFVHHSIRDEGTSVDVQDGSPPWCHGRSTRSRCTATAVGTGSGARCTMP
jgi:hypothetical protein